MQVVATTSRCMANEPLGSRNGKRIEHEVSIHHVRTARFAGYDLWGQHVASVPNQ